LIDSKHDAVAATRDSEGESTIPIVLAMIVLLFAAILALTGGASATEQKSAPHAEAEGTAPKLAQAQLPDEPVASGLRQPQ
jgi:hypothetical protein